MNIITLKNVFKKHSTLNITLKFQDSFNWYTRMYILYISYGSAWFKLNILLCNCPVKRNIQPKFTFTWFNVVPYKKSRENNCFHVSMKNGSCSCSVDDHWLCTCLFHLRIPFAFAITFILLHLYFNLDGTFDGTIK